MLREMPKIAIAPAPMMTPQKSITYHSGNLYKATIKPIAQTIEKTRVMISGRTNENKGTNIKKAVYPMAKRMMACITCFFQYFAMIRIIMVMTMMITKIYRILTGSPVSSKVGWNRFFITKANPSMMMKKNAMIKTGKSIFFSGFFSLFISTGKYCVPFYRVCF